jgi:hypothetical protein
MSLQTWCHKENLKSIWPGVQKLTKWHRYRKNSFTATISILKINQLSMLRPNSYLWMSIKSLIWLNKLMIDWKMTMNHKLRLYSQWINKCWLNRLKCFHMIRSMGTNTLVSCSICKKLRCFNYLTNNLYL